MKMLVAEDDSASRKMLVASVHKWGYEVVAVDNGLAALEELVKPDGPRLALLDWEMPEMEGVEVCRVLRTKPELPFRYLILLTARERQEDIVAALEEGADDYMTKPWTKGELQARLSVGRRILTLHEELEEKSRKLLLASETDYLTQVHNRSGVIKRLEQEQIRGARTHQPLVVFLMDVDHFKKINDVHGHAAGDNVLVEVARRLSNSLRPYDVLGRYGGEEFLAFAAGIAEIDARALGNRLRLSVCDSAIAAGSIEINATISVGGRWVSPGEHENTDDYINEADKMLYRAKESGRNRVEMASSKGKT